jgi:hypothetical protein
MDRFIEILLAATFVASLLIGSALTVGGALAVWKYVLQ